MKGFPTRAPADLEHRPRQQQWLVDGLWGRQAVGIVGGDRPPVPRQSLPFAQPQRVQHDGRRDRTAENAVVLADEMIAEREEVRLVGRARKTLRALPGGPFDKSRWMQVFTFRCMVLYRKNNKAAHQRQE